jgi:hypothetical protein
MGLFFKYKIKATMKKKKKRKTKRQAPVHETIKRIERKRKHIVRYTDRPGQGNN